MTVVKYLDLDIGTFVLRTFKIKYKVLLHILTILLVSILIY